MSVNQVGPELLKLLQMGKGYQSEIIKLLDGIYRKYGCMNVEKWRNMSNKKNSFLHELVEVEMIDVIRHIILEQNFDVETRRDSDGVTAYQLAFQNNQSKICHILEELGAQPIETVDVNQLSPDDEKIKSMNIIWLDLEFTSIEDPEIIECAVIITDKDLKELEKAEWVIHFDQKDLDKLGEWHQKTFADRKRGGNNLFADSVKSKYTRQDIEDRLLALISKHCPKGKCSLAGSSIHTDKDVLKKCMPKVHEYLHYRIIDVSSFQAVMRRWAPSIEYDIKRNLAQHRQETVNHRAMDDIIWSISFMKEFRTMMIRAAGSGSHRGGDSNQNNRGKAYPHARYKRSASEPQGAGNENLPIISPQIDTMELFSDEKQLVKRIEIEQNFDVRSLKLKDSWLKHYNENPHLREVFLNKQHIQFSEKKEFSKENRRLTVPLQQQSSFQPGANALKKDCTTEHWGQRKLFLTELEFLTKYAEDNSYLVVYAGAAPGLHIPFLSHLFPKLEFHLIDDKEFPLETKGKILIRSEKFSNDLAKEYYDSSRKILFICNVRTYRAQSNATDDLKEDLKNQLDWHTILRPQVSLLSFRHSREIGKLLYPKGNLIIEPWSSRRAIECRLVTDKDPKHIEYKFEEFEGAMRHFQNVTRIMYYEHDMDSVDNDGLDHCYDCRSEIYILEKYLIKIQNIKADSNLNTSIAKLSREISRAVQDKKRPSFINVERTLGIIPKKFIDKF